MRVIINAQFLLVSTLYVAQITQIYGDDDKVANMKYEILKVDEYISSTEKREISQSKVIINCGFESDWCGFQNEKQDDFNWTLTSKSTLSVGTGPKHDISGKGSYIYIETSVPRRVEDKARLTSPVIPPMVYCLQFGFHAWGADIGKLAVYRKGLDNKRDRMLSLDKNHGKNWHFVSVTVAHTSRFVIEFEGVCGKGYRGDIALDNITLTEGKCPTIQRNNTDQCGVGYPGFTNTIPGFPAYHAWPWLVWLSPNSQSQPSCPGVQVSSDWLLTTRDCARKFRNNDITTYTVNKKKRRNVLKIEERSTNTLQPVILKLNNSTSTRLTDKVCLPSSIPLQNRVTNCYLLGLSTLDHEKSFVEFPAIILSSRECQRDIQAASKTNLDLTRQLCVEVNSSFSFNDSQLHYGYLVCKNTIMNSWVLQAMGSFFKSDFKQNILVLRRVSFDVDWIENITNVSSVTPDVRRFTVPTPAQLASITTGFQIMERTNQECLTFESDKQKFTYTPCNDLDITQRFDWTQDHQLVTLHANSCLESDGTHLHFLQTNRCASRRRSQLWICKGNTIMNVFYASYIASKSDERSGVVQLTRVLAGFGHFVIFGTHDNLCSFRTTVKGVMKCDFNRHRTCGFDGVDSYAQFMWRISRTGSKEFMRFPSLVARDKFFRVIRRTNRGTPIAVLRSPLFRGQQCAEFRVFFQGSSLNQLNVYKDGGGEGKLMFQRNATTDHYWRFHRVTIVPTACEAFQVVFEAVFSDFTQSKVAIRDIVISPGACRSPKKRTDGECLKGWKLFNGQCTYFHDTKVTWHEASSICHIADAELITLTTASEVIPRGSPAWFGVRSCPTGRLYSAHGVPYNDTRLFTTPACLRAQKLRDSTTVYRTVQCDLKLPFACQKDPRTTRSTCGWRNVSAENDRQWPWHVLIVVGNRCVCGGTLIAPGYVVTSTLCLSRVWIFTVKLFFPSSRKMISKITRIINHSMSGVKSGDNDISIVIFEDDPSVHFACVMQISAYWTDDGDNLLKDKRCVVLGWGTFKGSYRSCGSDNYKAHEVEVVSRKTCSEYYGAHMITDRMICAKARNETTGNCLGDTGGPLVCEIAGTWTLVGVTTWGIGCSPTRKYGIYTDIGSMKPWIDIVSRENQYS